MAESGMRASALTLAFALAAGLSAAAVAAAPIAADDVFVTTAGAISVANEPGYTLHYSRSGMADYDGPLDGHYEALIDFSAVQTTVTQARLCERDGIPRFIEALSTKGYDGPNAAGHRQSVVVSLRCANGVMPNSVKTFNNEYAPDLPASTLR